MTAVVIDRKTLPEPMFSFFGTERITVSEHGTTMLLAPVEDAEAEDMDKIFDRILVPFGKFKFNRDEANNYE